MHRYDPSGRPDAGVDHADEDRPGWPVVDDVAEKERRLPDTERRDLMRQVMDRLRGPRRDHTPHRRDVWIARAEVGQEGDGHEVEFIASRARD